MFYDLILILCEDLRNRLVLDIDIKNKEVLLQSQNNKYRNEKKFIDFKSTLCIFCFSHT